MRMLFLTSRLPFPPHRGDRVRTFHFLERLSRDHDIHLLSFVESSEEERHIPELEPFCSVETVRLSRRRSCFNMLGGSLSSLPFQTLYYRSSEMKRKVDRISRETRFDLIYTHLFRMVPYSPAPAGAVRVLDLTDCVSGELAASLSHRSLLLRFPLRMEVGRIRRYEADVAARFDEVWTISDPDRQAIERMAPGSPIRVVPNGFDTALLDTLPGRGGTRLGFLGNFSVRHNIDAATFLVHRIMPRIREAVPQARLDLIGHGLTGAVERLDGKHGTSVIGPVRRLQDSFAPLTLFVSPLRFAAGIQNKIIEAMAAGLPVVTTSHGNRGLGAKPDEEIVVSDDPGRFADAAISLLENPDRASSLGLKGRAFVRRKYSWDAVADRILCLVPAAAGAAPSPL